MTGGFVILLVCADFLVRGAVGLARIAGLTPLVIGLTVVAFGTSAPEFVTALTATLSGATGMAAGNIIGSNIANVLLILGIAAMMRPIACSRQTISRDGVTVLIASTLFVLLSLFGEVSRFSGLVLIASLGGYLMLTYRHERSIRSSTALHALEAEEITSAPQRWPVAGALLFGGIVGISVGADLLVDGAVDIALAIGVSNTLIGLTLIAVGTSLPELATVIMASLRQHGDVALGNVLGSNIFNLLAIAGGVSAISPISVPREILHFDIWILLATSLLLLPMMISDRRISRREGGFLVSMYALYLLAQIAMAVDWFA